MYKSTLLSSMMIALMLLNPAWAAYRCERPGPEGRTDVVFSDLVMEGYVCQDLRDAPPPPVDPDEAMERLREQVDALDEANDSSAAGAAEADAPDDPRAAQMAENCQISQDNLRVLESGQDVVTADAEGNKSLLGSDQRERQLEQTRKDIDYFCNP